MSKLIALLFACFYFVAVHAQTELAVDTVSNSEGKIHNEIFKINLFPMIGGRLSFDYEIGINSKLGKASLLFGVDAFGVFPVTQYSENQPKGYAGALTYRQYFKSSNGHPLDGSFVQLSGRVGILNHVEPRSILVAPSQYVTIDERINNTHATIFLGIGKQYVLYDRFALEYSLGVGAYISNNDLSKESLYAVSPQNTPTIFGFWNYGDTPLALTFGIKMGYVFGGFMN
jgi:hypothetical protein